ncbi:MAG TPA: 30S ribosome-binding factor RbfA [Erysipelothrix sp.]|nr:30S ribosome-binding factor RbfA [Erysipelothrix sp.]
MSIKRERIESTIKKELAPIINNRLNDPSLKFVSITDVKLTNDMSFAYIYVSFLEAKNKEKGMEALIRSKGTLRSEVAKTLTTRRSPDLVFKLDESLETGNKIETILAQIKDEQE